jgi:hypothetical protein
MQPSSLFSKAWIRTATRRQQCNGHRLHWVDAGEPFLVVRHRRFRSVYCRECGHQMVATVLKELNALLEFVSHS